MLAKTTHSDYITGSLGLQEHLKLLNRILEGFITWNLSFTFYKALKTNNHFLII